MDSEMGKLLGVMVLWCFLNGSGGENNRNFDFKKGSRGILGRQKDFN